MRDWSQMRGLFRCWVGRWAYLMLDIMMMEVEAHHIAIKNKVLTTPESSTAAIPQPNAATIAAMEQLMNHEGGRRMICDTIDTIK